MPEARVKRPPKRGYRFEAAVTETGRATLAALPASATLEPTNSASAGTGAKRAAALAWLVAAIAIIILTAYLVRSYSLVEEPLWKKF